MNCLYSVRPGKLEVIILITLINSGGTDSLRIKIVLLSRTALLTGFFFYLILLFSTNIPKGMAVQLPHNNR